ncbi:MAG: transposase, partial [Clostridiales Family XIII bacterium]|nr:transposase [Clostridiales Family XIII bacterium]
MKLYYDKRAKDPIYYVQHGYRNGKKTTTRNVGVIGRHSELLKITDDPLAYARKEIEKRNKELSVNKFSIDVKIDFDERLRHSDAVVSKGSHLNVGYFALQGIYRDLKL